MSRQRQRLTAEERREAIIQAVVPVFAEKGFHGATTKDLANAASVSEALLYRHFPSKEDLFAAISAHHFQDDFDDQGYPALLELPPSTERLVLGVQFLVGHLADDKESALSRMLAHSLLGDGEFAKTMFRQGRSSVFTFLTESIEVAIESGDIEASERHPELLWWMVQHLGLGLKLSNLPGRRTTSYGARRAEVIDLAARFCLRGIGLSDDAIAKYYDPGAYKRFGFR